MEHDLDEPYSVLGLEPGASRDDITRAYRKLVRRYPPELNPERFAKIHRAHALLNDVERQMAEVRKDPVGSIEALFPPPTVTLAAAPPAPLPLEPGDLEPLIGPLRRQLLQRILKLSLGEG